MRRLFFLVAAVALLLVAASPAGANNDPHRFAFARQPPSGGFPAGWPCAFAIHGETLVDKSYASDVVARDGTETFRVAGSFKARLSANGKSIDVNASGPMTEMFYPDGTGSFKFEGRQFIYAPWLPELGFPSPIVVFSGLFEGAFDSSGVVSVSHMPHVDLDICAALS